VDHHHFNIAMQAEAQMRHTLSRRDFLFAVRTGAVSIGLAELGLPFPAMAEENFTVSIVGGTWGQGQIKT
jgi:hypothetical protein